MDFVSKLCRFFTYAALGILVLFGAGCRCQGQSLILGGAMASIEHFPYHVAIYEQIDSLPGDYAQICAGTLISTNQVVTAAHCFWDMDKMTQKEATRYRVAAGKTWRAWSYQANDKAVQKRNVASISIHRRYRGRTLLEANDIALLILDEPVKLTSSVGLAHIDWKDTWTQEQLAFNKTGTVAGWGIAKTGNASDELMYVSLPYIDFDTCFDSLDIDLKRFLTADKFCGGFLNRNISACPGDSGGGLVFYHPATDKKYLRGIVSYAFRPFNATERCYAQHYTAFTILKPDVLHSLRPAMPMKSMTVCGRRGRSTKPLIAGRRDADLGEFPWHVGIYLVTHRTKKTSYLCGGTLITTKFVLSAAYCFYDGSTSKVKYVTAFRISAGANRVSYEEAAILRTTQIFRVAKISLPSKLRGRGVDIAVVQLIRPAVITATVAPVCVDWENEFEDEQLRVGVEGVIPGYGSTNEGDTLSTQLRWIEMPYVPLETCTAFAESQGVEHALSAPDFCAGDVNETEVIRRGDGGGGFSVLRGMYEQYYLRGVVGVGLYATSVEADESRRNGYVAVGSLAPLLGWIRDLTKATDIRIP